MRDPFWSWNRSISFPPSGRIEVFPRDISSPLRSPFRVSCLPCLPCNFSDPQKMCNHVEEAHWKTLRVGHERESFVRSNRRVSIWSTSLSKWKPLIKVIKKWRKKSANLYSTFHNSFDGGKKGGRFAKERNKGKPVRYWTCEMRIDSIQTIKCQCDNCAKSYI